MRSVNISQVRALRETAVPSRQQSGVRRAALHMRLARKVTQVFQPRVGLFTSLWRGLLLLFSHHLSVHWLVPSPPFHQELIPVPAESFGEFW